MIMQHVVKIHQAFGEPSYDPERNRYGLHVKAEYDGEIEETTIWYEDEDEAYEMYNHLSNKIEPVVIHCT